MKLSFVICTMLSISFSFAQLSVRNDAFIYVTDEVLFVNDDVNLEEIDSKIYLRDESQLIQGSGTTGNSGIGKLSVYQTGTVNAFAYNYWCSPVGYVLESDNSSPLDTNSNNYFQPNANIFEPIGNTDPSLDPITSSIAIYTSSYEGTSSPFQISRRWIYSFNAGNPGTANDYPEWDYVGHTGTVTPAHGFTMKGNPSNSQLYDFRGKPNNGEMTATIIQEEQTLVGNPYPSALDALLFIHDTDNSGLADVNGGSGMTGALYYWEQAPGAASHYVDQYVGGYATYTISAGGIPSFVSAPFTTYNPDGSINTVGNAGVDGNKTAHRYIPIGQGFMVEGASGSGTSLVYFKNSHRAYYKQSDPLSYFFRNSTDNYSTENATTENTQYDDNGNYLVPEDYKRFRINVDFNAGNSQYTRQLLMNFHSTATDGFDYGLEAKGGTESNNTDAYWSVNDEAYIIQALNFNEDLAIPLIVNITQQQPLRFRIMDVQNFDVSQGIYIHDIENDVYLDLREQNYDINIEPGNYTERFEIVFTTDSTLAIDEFDVNSLTIRQDNSIKQLSVQNPNNLDILRIEIFDVTGKRIIKTDYDAIETDYNLSTVVLSDGVYIVNVLARTGANMTSQKVIVKN